MRTPPPGAIVSAIRHMDYSSLPRLIRLITRLALRASGPSRGRLVAPESCEGRFRARVCYFSLTRGSSLAMPLKMRLVSFLNRSQ